MKLEKKSVKKNTPEEILLRLHTEVKLIFVCPDWLIFQLAKKMHFKQLSDTSDSSESSDLKKLVRKH